MLFSIQGPAWHYGIPGICWVFEWVTCSRQCVHVQNGVPTAVLPPHIRVLQTHGIPCIETSNRSQLRLTHGK